MILKPHEGQQEFALRQPYSVNEILYGGARGGGKTFAGLIWLTEYVDNPRFQGLVIRKNADDLSDWVERARYMYSSFDVNIAYRPPILRFPSGAIIRTGHLKDDAAFTKYQGHEYQKILIEELTQIPTESRYLQLLSSNRSTVPELKPQMFCTTNPGGAGMLWVKKRFINDEPNKMFVAEDGLKRIYIPATIDDNPTLKSADPDYIKRLDALKTTDPELYKAWRFGEWNVFIGQVFDEWREDKHVIDGLSITKDDFAAGKKIVGMDWGYNDPASFHWILLLPENAYGVRRVFIYRELYEGKRTPESWAYELAERFRQEPIDYMVLPHDAYSHLGGRQTIASAFEDVFNRVCGFGKVKMIRANSLAQGARANRQAIMHQLLSDSPDGKPYLQVHRSCKHLIETLPTLSYSQTKPEDIDSNAEDHAYDSATYGLMTILDLESMVIGGEIPDETKKSYLVDGSNRIDDFTINISKAIESSMEGGKDWKYL